MTTCNLFFGPGVPFFIGLYDLQMGIPRPREMQIADLSVAGVLERETTEGLPNETTCGACLGRALPILA